MSFNEFVGKYSYGIGKKTSKTLVKDGRRKPDEKISEIDKKKSKNC